MSNHNENDPHYTNVNKHSSNAAKHTHYEKSIDASNEKAGEYREYEIDALENLDDWKVHHDDTDVRGWELHTTTGEKIGTIENLIADTGAKRILYLEVETDSGLNKYNTDSYREYIDESFYTYYEKAENRHILVPIGMVSIQEEEEVVIAAPNLTPAHFASSPRFEGIKQRKITPLYQLLTTKHYSRDNDYYREYYNNYDLLEYSKSTTNKVHNNFYESDFFNRDRYHNRLSNKKMMGFDSGARK